MPPLFKIVPEDIHGTIVSNTVGQPVAVAQNNAIGDIKGRGEPFPYNVVHLNEPGNAFKSHALNLLSARTTIFY